MSLFRFAASVLAAAVCIQPVMVCAASFPDMQDQWFGYSKAVEGLQSRQIIGGYPDGTFRPDTAINRAELLKIVFKGRNVTAADRRCFSDINPDEWYAPYVCAAKRRGIIDGYPDGTYKPDRTVNFAEAIKIILGAYGREIDDAEGEQWYAPYVDNLNSADILPAHSYIPWEELTRLRAADVLWRILQYDEESVIPRFSEGCGKAKPALGSTVNVSGEERSYLLTVPESYIIHDPVPLVLAFHGRTNSNTQVRSYYKFDKEMKDTIVVYPAARSNGNGTFNWSIEGDLSFVDALIEQLSEQYCIDMDRIFVAGHSLGGWFSNSLACVRGDVIRASASVGSSSIITDCAGPSAAMIIHNPDDRLSPFSGSVRNREMRVEENGCNWSTSPVSPEALLCVSHAECTNNPVHFCPHENDTSYDGEYYPHNWPKSAGKAMTDFFTSL
ncbi:hypothetical protein COU75_01585 [Candidatus Peregrinibacteria bacterium CG10_big_fil_rev_8_21_14_0_10_42_8]|nr:MAG: hypothetical protein COU75_01585 [Candidatus Peregrinibacteria bacterium CG10_big_fil_rev_8_21_14_0_10_42_8]